MMNKKSITKKLLAFLPLILFVCFWHFSTIDNNEAKFIFSTPIDIVTAFWDLVATGELFLHAAITLYEALFGFVIGTFFGVILGLSLWYSPLAAYIAKPYIVAISAVPVFALAPIMIVWFGIGFTSKIMIAALSTFTVAMSQAFQGAQSCEEKHLRLMQVMKATRWQAFRIVVVPSAMIWVVNSMKLNIGLALLGAFIGEFIASEKGLGFIIVKASGLYDMATVFAACFMLTMIALILSGLVSIIEKAMLKFNH